LYLIDHRQPPILTLGLSATKFAELGNSKSIEDYFANKSTKQENDQSENQNEFLLVANKLLPQTSKAFSSMDTNVNTLSEDDSSEILKNKPENSSEIELITDSCEEILIENDTVTSKAKSNVKNNDILKRYDSKLLAKSFEEFMEKSDSKSSEIISSISMENSSQNSSTNDADDFFKDKKRDSSLDKSKACRFEDNSCDVLLIDEEVNNNQPNKTTSANNVQLAQKPQKSSKKSEKLMQKSLGTSSTLKSKTVTILDMLNKNATANASKNKVKNKPNNLDEVDYVSCEKCDKKILCWEMPEHEDFHYAQEIAKQQQKELTKIQPPSISSEQTNKKRPIDEIARNDLLIVDFSKARENENSKKQKTRGVDHAASNKSNIKSIDSYMKKL
jgi:hypothetical protein